MPRKKKIITYVRTRSQEVADELGIPVNFNEKVTNKRFKEINKDERFEIGIILSSIFRKDSMIWHIKKRTMWDKIRRWFMKHGLSKCGGWSFEYRILENKKYRYTLSFCMGHWRDLFKELFRVFSDYSLEGFNFHLFSIWHHGPGYMMDYRTIGVTVCNFDFTFYKTWK